ncbi:MAG TPA: hypothetical protein VKF39_02230, partial [Nitrososphaerales archaeon]|nr:hypothetical protein [Nitrososphaerales archaeon]
GRAHPMIYFTLRKMRIMQEARDPQTAVLLLDVELGLGSNPGPAGELVPALREAKELCRNSGRYLSVVASVVGTDGDFHGLASQEAKLRDAGVILTGSNACGILGSSYRESGRDPGEQRRFSMKTSKGKGLVGKKLKVINVGIPSFANDLESQGAEVVRTDWKPQRAATKRC